MDINAAKRVLVRTHIAALEQGHRASGMHLESGPGVGKSDGTFQYAEDLARRLDKPVGLVQFMLATISSVDVRGFMLPVKNASGSSLDTMFSTPPWYPVRANTWVVTPQGKWCRPGTWDGTLPEVGVLFLDEFSQADDEVKKPAAELVYKGTVGTCELPIGWRVVAAGNRLSDRSGVVRELMFIVNRRCKLSVDASLPAWLEWANNRKVPPHYLTMSFAQKNPDIVFKESIPEGTEPFCTPRTLCLLDQDLLALRDEEDERRDRLPTDSLSREVAAGWIGGPSAAQFFTHLKYADELPDLADIEKTPSKAKLPAEKSAQMVAAYMLAHNITEKNASAMMTYLRRMYIEMQVLAVRAITAPGQEERTKGLIVNPEYVNWLMANKKLIQASQS